jgi:hypothetical protein
MHNNEGVFMKYTVLMAAMLAVASPALALKVTNLDTVAHTVEWSGRGAPELRVIKPNATENFVGAVQGFLSLKSAKTIKKAQGVVQSDGLLSGIIGNGRNQRIPADAKDSFVIWPDGSLKLQGRIKPTQGR